MSGDRARLDAVRWTPHPAPWPSSGPLLRLAVELLPETEEESLAVLVEELAILLCERDEQVAAIRQVLSVALDKLHRAQLAIPRLRDRLNEIEARERKASHARRHPPTHAGKQPNRQTSKQTRKQRSRDSTAATEGTAEVDMREKLKGSLLSSADVENLGGAYVGEVADVVEEDVRSPGTGRTERDAVVEFTDGIRWVPSNTAKRVLIKLHGFETDSWRGKMIEINLRERRGQLEKYVVEPDGTDAPHVKREKLKGSLLSSADVENLGGAYVGEVAANPSQSVTEASRTVPHGAPRMALLERRVS